MLEVGAFDEIDDSTVRIRGVQCTLKLLYLRQELGYHEHNNIKGQPDTVRFSRSKDTTHDALTLVATTSPILAWARNHCAQPQ